MPFNPPPIEVKTKAENFTCPNIKVDYYARVRNDGKTAISSSLPYNTLGPGRWAERIEPGCASRMYPISLYGMSQLLNTETPTFPKLTQRPDGSYFCCFEIMEKD